MTNRPHPCLSRRRALCLIAVTASGTVLAPASLARSADELLPGADVCVLTPETTEGPYYFDPQLVRRDIAEGRDGVATLLRLQVVDARCRPLPGARVDVWHCDAQGVYSSYGGSEPGQDSARGETFLRGTQFGDERGVVEFATIYPGWYGGRTPHIHFKVFVSDSDVLTGQIFFPDAVSTAIYARMPAYARTSGRRTTNDGDFIARRALPASLATVAEDGGVYLAQAILGVDPAA